MFGSLAFEALNLRRAFDYKVLKLAFLEIQDYFFLLCTLCECEEAVGYAGRWYGRESLSYCPALCRGRPRAAGAALATQCCGLGRALYFTVEPELEAE